MVVLTVFDEGFRRSNNSARHCTIGLVGITLQDEDGDSQTMRDCAQHGCGKADVEHVEDVDRVDVLTELVTAEQKVKAESQDGDDVAVEFAPQWDVDVAEAEE